MAEDKYKGLVIANDGPNFSAGANVGMIFMLAIEQDYDEIDISYNSEINMVAIDDIYIDLIMLYYDQLLEHHLHLYVIDH
jgi:hypothetical protein